MSESKKEINLTKAFTELESIVSEFEEGEIDLDKGIEKLKRGAQIAKDVKSRLSILENEIEVVRADLSDDTSNDIISSDSSSESE